MRLARVVFAVAGIYGIGVIAPMYLMEERIGRDYPPVITHPEYFYGFLGVTLAWQVLFLVLSSDPVRYRPMILPAILEKLFYGCSLIMLMAQHRVGAVVIYFGCVDWIFAALFCASYWATGRRRT